MTGIKRSFFPMICFTFIAALVLQAAFVDAATAPTEAWVARYDRVLDDSADSACALAVDDSGNVYVTGTSGGTTTGDNYATVKYDSKKGNQVWAAIYDAGGDDQASALAVDSSGNVYVTGKSAGNTNGNDYATIKYNKKGAQLWVARYDAGGDDQASALAVDGAGNVYVTGVSASSGFFQLDYATVKYDSNGNQLWVARYDASNDDRASALAVDGAGNVYVTGRSGEPSAPYYDYATVKYDSNGNELWVARYDGPATISSDLSRAIGLDALGNIYITGTSSATDTSGNDYTTIKYNSSGTQLWVATYNAGFEDHPFALAVDGAGNVYVTGANSSFDYATVKYDTNGNELWVSTYDGGIGWVDVAYAIELDASGNVHVTGRSENNTTGNDYATIKYDSSGTQLWVARYDGPASGSDVASALALDGSGNVYVTGGSMGDSPDYATIKY